ncbi:MAG TPA: D-2-hydroxyacid dehydrogenase, partial [Anaerolineales bacterium]|nr:D-2-hydroxyacid dehydrogenase [Anaerolineales bacterium]
MSEPIEVLITMPFPERLTARLAEVSPRLKITVQKASKVEDIPTELWSRVQILYTNKVVPPPELVPRLRWIQFHWAGVDHIIDDPLLRKPGLAATTLSGAASSQMAEYILMMLLALGHRLPDLIAHQKSIEWPSDRWERFSPKELRDSTVGIVGYGSIGRQLARLLHPLGAIVLATKQNAMQPEDAGYIPEGMGDPGGDFVHRLYPSQALRSMLKDCDFVVITVPKTPTTADLISEAELAALKPSAFLIDVSRGGIVNHQALIQALKDHKIAGAALDVFPEEPLPVDSSLWKLTNVILTPH